MLKDYSWKGETFRDFKKRMWFLSDFWYNKM
jgi:hypothetical protein